LAICTENEIGDFDIAFAYEALTRAYAVAGDVGRGKEYVRLGEQAGARIQDKDNREYFLSELKTVSDLLG
jgi:hypothetical protein